MSKFVVENIFNNSHIEYKNCYDKKYSFSNCLKIFENVFKNIFLILRTIYLNVFYQTAKNVSEDPQPELSPSPIFPTIPGMDVLL